MSKATAGDLIPAVVRELDLPPGAHPHGNLWLHATSGLVCIGHHAYVVADDEHHLGHFRLDTPAPVELLRLFPGKLPRDKGKRKKAKPDLETLVLLPALELFPHGALLALGSGSRPTRNRGTLLGLDRNGKVLGSPLELDLTSLYAPLQQHFAGLNIEGAFVTETGVHLMQRGNKGSNNARISFDRTLFLDWLLNDSAGVPQLTRVQLLDLGLVDGVPLTPTDATTLTDNRWLFCAVAENTGDSYTDGDCLASLIGIADAHGHGHIERTWHLHGNPKVEGIALEPGTDPAASQLNVLLVTDADDPQRASQLLRCVIHQR
jgi:hypothetical protein